MKEFNFTGSQVICDLQRKSQKAIIRPRNRALFAAAATLICEFRDRMTIAERERKEMAAILKEEHGCILCEHWSAYSASIYHKPCAACKAGEGMPNWKWQGKR